MMRTVSLTTITTRRIMTIDPNPVGLEEKAGQIKTDGRAENEENEDS